MEHQDTDVAGTPDRSRSKKPAGSYTTEALAAKFASILPFLNERQRRLLLAAEARALGWGGTSLAAAAAEVSRQLISRGLEELTQSGQTMQNHIRRPGAGRKELRHKQPELIEDLDRLVDPATRGDPMSPLRWTCKSTSQLAKTLNAMGYSVSPRTVAHLLHQEGYSLQANSKTREGTMHPDREQQFRYLNDQVKRFLDAGQPVVLVDGKKKEVVGKFKNGGR